jgi:dihydroorotate dehydrogenase electron transfer subunit
MPLDEAAEVIANRTLSEGFSVLALAAPAIAAAAAPGQFVMVKARGGHDPLLRRPFSVFEILRDGGNGPIGISLLNKSVGAATRLLYEARPGQRVQCLGPLGRSFALVEPPVDAWMVAGGVGLAPFATLAQALRARGVATTLFYGARTSNELFYLDFFLDLGVQLVLSTEDGSIGERGRIIGPLERRFASHPVNQSVMVYACGPEGMLAAVAKAAVHHGRACQISVERMMGCGTGGCYSCVVPMRTADGRFHHVRSCLSGPVLPGDQIRWE